MPREIDLSLLRAFVTVAEAGGMTAAGRHLNLTQAAVSQQIKRLEEQFDTELFDRSQRRPELTQAGERLFAHAERILSLNEEIWGLMTSRGFEGEVRIGVPTDIVGHYMPPILREFAKAWPCVELYLFCRPTTELLRMLDQGEIDVIVTTEAKPNDKSQLLLSDQLVWVGAPAGSAHERTPLPVTLGDDQCTFRTAAVKALGAAGRDWRFTCSSSETSAFYTTLEADLAVAPLLSQTVPERLEILGPESGLPTLPTYYVNLYLAPADPSAISQELAKLITKGFAARYSKAA